MTNHRINPDPNNHPKNTFINPKEKSFNHLSFSEDYRKGDYYIKHLHNIAGETQYYVFKDDPCPERNWRGNQPLATNWQINILIDWINKRRCFKKEKIND